MEVGIGFGLVWISTVAWIIYYSLKTWKTTLRDWQIIAETLGLQHIQKSSWSLGKLEGTYAGFPVIVDQYSTGGKDSRLYTRITTSFNQPLPKGLQIYQETPVFSDIGKFFGGQDIQIQDPAFDDTFIIKGTPEEDVKRLLTPAVRAALTRYHYVTHLRLDEHKVVHSERGDVRDPSHIRHILDAQHEVAKALCGLTPNPSP